MSQAAASPSPAASGPQFTIHKIFSESASLESPLVPEIFTQNSKPKTLLDVNSSAQQTNDAGVYRVTLRLTATVKNTDNERTIFVAEVKQSGIFTITGMEQKQLDHTLGSFCPTTLFPYARESLSNLVKRGGFSDLHIAPINFDAIYFDALSKTSSKVQ